MKTLRFACEQWLPLPPAAVFPFFADPFNLQAITPPWLDFRVVGSTDATVRLGTEIDYRLRLHGVPLRWKSRITEWDPPHGFTDEQLRGPYRRWVHRHRFAARDGGTHATDTVDYAVLGGALVARLFVARDVERIFAYRREQLAQRFAAAPQPQR